MSNNRFSAIMEFAAGDRRREPADSTPKVPRVLVVDDDPGLQLIMSETLSDAGFEVAVASAGNEAVELCAEFLPDLVLLDINMPGMDGIAACAEMRRQSKRSFPIIMVTSVDDASSIQNAFDAGATDFILKPVNWPIFQRRLASVLGEWNTSEALDESKKRLGLLEKVAPEKAMLVNRAGVIVEDLKRHRTARTLLANRPGETVEAVYGADIALRFKQKVSGVLKTGRDNRLEFTVAEQNVIRNFEAEFLAHGRDSVLVVVQNVSNDQDKKSEVYELAFYDEASGYPNRHLFQKFAEDAIANASLHESGIALVSLTVDGLTGRQAQQKELVRQLLDQVNQCLLAAESVARIGRNTQDARLARLEPNRFGFIVTRDPDNREVAALCEQLDDVILQGLEGHNSLPELTLRCGTASFPGDGHDLATIEHAALLAMEEAVLKGELLCYATQAPAEAASTPVDYGAELRQAMKNGELELYFQPRIALPDGVITSIEALLRWNHPMRGFVDLDELLPLAKASGLIIELGDWVLRAACTAAMEWEGSPLPRISVNLSQEEFSRQDLADRILDVLSLTDMPAERIELEFTEAALLRTRNELVDLVTLNDLGVGLVLDNFGTGHSSLTLLKQYPIDTIKIDGAFVRNLTSETEDRAVCEVIVSMAHKFGMRAVAENVETEEQLDILKEMGCDEFQGYHICKPLSADRLELYLRRHFLKKRR